MSGRVSIERWRSGEDDVRSICGDVDADLLALFASGANQQGAAGKGSRQEGGTNALPQNYHQQKHI